MGEPLPARIKIPDSLRSPVQGGTDLWDRAQVAWEMRQSLPEFEARPEEEQNWLLATWQTMRKIKALETIATAH